MTGNETERDALARFEALLDAYGAEPRRWPADRRAASESLLARSPEAQALHAAARRLDGLLDAAAVEPAPAHLIGRVLAAAPKPAAARGGWIAGLFKPAAGIALAAVLGLGLGGVISPFGAANGDVADAESITLAIGDVPEVEL
jgi:hypothetical protein